MSEKFQFRNKRKGRQILNDFRGQCGTQSNDVDEVTVEFVMYRLK